MSTDASCPCSNVKSNCYRNDLSKEMVIHNERHKLVFSGAILRQNDVALIYNIIKTEAGLSSSSQKDILLEMSICKT